MESLPTPNGEIIFTDFATMRTLHPPLAVRLPFRFSFRFLPFLTGDRFNAVAFLRAHAVPCAVR